MLPRASELGEYIHKYSASTACCRACIFAFAYVPVVRMHHLCWSLEESCDFFVAFTRYILMESQPDIPPRWIRGVCQHLPVECRSSIRQPCNRTASLFPAAWQIRVVGSFLHLGLCAKVHEGVLPGQNIPRRSAQFCDTKTHRNLRLVYLALQRSSFIFTSFLLLPVCGLLL